ncbi:hypothetical protein CEE44_04525 [Candidatus Woesearchaeota archaeon B3_Woes]|nr:MAG: hypothetical protein CEE44_04525 [Candidatus Woesearchaeota archaeon B3_Woes]
MTILYILLHKPQTIDEFVQEVQRKGYTSVDIVIAQNGKNNLKSIHGDFFEAHYTVRLESGKIRLKLATYDATSNTFNGEKNVEAIHEIKEKEALIASLMYSESVAYRLQQKDLETTINGKPIENARNRSNQCRQQIEKLDKLIIRNKYQGDLFK